MFERFTHHARQVMAMANREAQRFNHKQIRTEHVLLAIVKLGKCVGAMVLKPMVGDDLRQIRLQIEERIVPGPEEIWQGKLPQTLQVRNMIDQAIEEARNLNHNYIGTEHLLLGLLSESESVAAQVLMNQGLKLEDMRNEVLNVVGRGTTARDAGSRHAMLKRLYGAQFDSVEPSRTDAVLKRCVDVLPWVSGLIAAVGLLLLITYVVTSIKAVGAHTVWVALLLFYVLTAWTVLAITTLQIERHLRNHTNGHSPSSRRNPTSPPAGKTGSGTRSINRQTSTRGDTP